MNKKINAVVNETVENSRDDGNISFVSIEHHNIIFEAKIKRLNKICWKIIHFICLLRNSNNSRIQRNDL